MDAAVAGSAPGAYQPSQLTFEDGLGERRYALGALNEPLEVLRLSSVLSAVSSFDFALRERAARLASFRYESFTKVRAVELDKRTSTLVVFSDFTPGVRLSTLLADAEKRSLPIEINVARTLIRQLVSAAVAWRHAVTDATHGALGPERLIVTPAGRLVVAEYVLGAAMEQLGYSRARYWRELRIPLPDGPGAPQFDARTEVTQVGAVALSLILGRPLTTEEFPDRLRELISGSPLRTVMGAHEPLPSGAREWLSRALQLDPRASFESIDDARATLDQAFGDENPVAELGALQVFLARHATGDAADLPSEADLGSQLEAMKAFLARYPGRRQNPPSTASTTVATPNVLPGSATMSATPAPTAPLTQTPTRTESAKLDTPKVETGKLETAKPDTAKFETPRFEAPRVEPPKTETLGADTSRIELPRVELPRIDLPRESTRVELPRVEPSSVADQVLYDLESPAPPQSYVDERRSAIPVRNWSRHVRVAGAIVLGVILLGLGVWGILKLRSGAGAATGTISVNTTPPGVSISIDGQARGVTPITVELPPGDHLVELRTETERRRIPITLTAGAQISQFLEFARTAPTSGELLVRTDPASASVTVDGTYVGRSPLSVPELSAGTHTVVLQHEAGTLTERVLIENGRTASLVVSIGGAPKASAAGWITLDAPNNTDVQVFENERFLGSSKIDRIMLPIGRHDLDIVNEELGFRERRTVQVAAGQVSRLRLEWPNGSLALNAIPWAEVFIDGTRVGETPIGNISVPIGNHEVVFRHPELGERRASVTVTSKTPVKVGFDLRVK